MNFQSLVRGACAVLAAVILGSCGGGGAQLNPNRGGEVGIEPGGGDTQNAPTFFAGVQYTFTLSGVPPFSLTSTEQTVLPVPSTTSSFHVDVVPNNPGVIDSGLPAGSLLFRTVNVVLRDSLGNRDTAIIHVAQNFLTGYQVFYTPSTCPQGTQACSGGQTLVRFDTVTNGLLYGNRPFTVSMVKGGCLFENPAGSSNLAPTITSSTDHEGILSVVMDCPGGTAPGVGLIRIEDVASGASTLTGFTITGAAAGNGLTVIPDTVDFVGQDSATCGTGDSQVLVFGGQPPYSATSSTTGITVSPGSTTQPGMFTVSVHGATQPCPVGKVIITDANLQVATVDVKSETGQGAPPPAPSPPLSATPSGATLTCGQSQAILVTGGTGGPLSAVSNNPKVTVSVAANVVTVTRALDANNPVGSTQSTVSVTDGTNVINIPVNNPLTCT